MDAILDLIWEKIAAGGIWLANGFDALVAPFHFLGPGVIIFILAVMTVLVTKSLNRLIITKRYVELEKEFKHWHALRQEALTCPDRDKGRALAKNIDQAKLNKVYYDYFFEGLLLGLVRKIIPIFFVFAYINEYFKPQRLLENFGRTYVFQLGGTGGDPVLVGTVFWFVSSLLLVYLGWGIGRRVVARLKKDAPLLAGPASDVI